MLFLRSAKSIDPQYYLADRGRELSHVDAAQRALLGSASTTYFSGSQVTEEGFVSFLNGQPLDAKRPLTSKHRSVHALELLAVAPKVASIAALLGNDAMAGAVVEGHHQALEGALRYLEHHGAWSNHADQQPLEGLSAVRFTHGISRARDPHLHSHVVIANLGRTTTGRFGTIDQRVLRAHLDAASALYDAALFARCAEMGVPVVQPPEMIAALSTRQAEARQLWFQQRRRLTAHDGDDVVKDTPSRRDLLAKWHRQLHAVGLTVSDVLAHVPTRPRQQLRLDEDHFRRRLLGDDRKVTRRKVVEAWAWASGGAPARKVDAAVDLVIGRESLPFERELREVDAIASDRSRRMLGDRPLDPSRLERWLPAARLLDRSTSLAYRDWTRDRDRSSRSDRQGWSR